jgi:hypothetical protein
MVILRFEAGSSGYRALFRVIQGPVLSTSWGQNGQDAIGSGQGSEAICYNNRHGKYHHPP